MRDPVSDARLSLTSGCGCPQGGDESHLFEDEEQATLFLGALDSIFLFSYAVVRRQSFLAFVIILNEERPACVASI